MLAHIRKTLPIIGIIVLALAVGCTAAAPTQTPTEAPTEVTTEAPTEAAAATEEASVFPVTITHKYGTTTIEQEPVRVLSVGYTEQDSLLALGVTPIAIRYWYDDEDGIQPWAEPLVKGEKPVVMKAADGALDYEQILSLQPDIIMGVTSGMTQEEYDKLSQIAPTIPQSGEYIDYGMPWQACTQMMGDALGKHDEAAKLIADIEAKFADARAKNPNFEGKSVAVAWKYDNSFGFYTAQDTRGRFFSDLGFVVPDELVEIAGDAFYSNISSEKLGLLDRDLIAFVNLSTQEGGLEALEADPLYAALSAVREDRVLYFEKSAETALHFSSPLSLGYALDDALPKLEAIFSE